MHTYLSKIVFLILDFLFPSRCVYCAKTISFQDNCLCNSCMQNIILIEEKCDICSGTLENERCTICSDRELFITKNIIVAEYAGVMKEVLHNYKFNHKKRLHLHLSRLSYPHIEKYKNSFDIVSSVPMKRSKKYKRGFNQSELVARDLAKKMNKKYNVLLKEKLFSRVQKELNYRDRFFNIIGRYKTQKIDRIKNRKVLIVDDVFTTGATINECARILKYSGAKDVYSLVLARVNINPVANKN
ncbi:MAG: ComF family protein [Spirochaetota bacterium]|nr:ComF family protein [Spirochaetota bacterium]